MLYYAPIKLYTDLLIYFKVKNRIAPPFIGKGFSDVNPNSNLRNKREFKLKENPKMWGKLPNHLKSLNSFKVGHHKNSPVDYAKNIFIMLVSFSKEIGKYIHIFFLLLIFTLHLAWTSSIINVTELKFNISIMHMRNIFLKKLAQLMWWLLLIGGKLMSRLSFDFWFEIVRFEEIGR